MITHNDAIVLVVSGQTEIDALYNAIEHRLSALAIDKSLNATKEFLALHQIKVRLGVRHDQA
jgi:hypothetical protein